MSSKRQKNNNGMTERTPVNHRASLPSMDSTYDDEDSYDPDELDESDAESYEEESSNSSGRKVTFKTPAKPMRRYIPDFSSLPKTGVWISPAPGRHTEFLQVVVRTTKCDICNEKVGDEKDKVMQRCLHCNKQFCRKCENRVSGDDRHFPVLSELVWDAQSKPNDRTRDPKGFKDNMYTRPKVVVRPIRPLSASEKLAASRNIAPGTFKNTVSFATLAPSRPSRARPSKATKGKKPKPRALPPGYTSEEVDCHYELDWEFIRSLPANMQRKEKKEADMRNLMRKRNLETMENPAHDISEDIPAPFNARTPLPSSGAPRRMANPRPTATRRRYSRLSSKPQVAEPQYESPSEPNARDDSTEDFGDVDPRGLQRILDGLSKNSQVAQQIHRRQEVEKSDASDEYETTPIQDEYQHQERLQAQGNNAEEEDYEPEFNSI